MVRVTKALPFVLFQAAVGHYVWLSEPEDRNDEAVITFGEGGKPGPAVFLNMIADKVSLNLCNSTSNSTLALARRHTSPFGVLGEELVAHIDSTPPFSLYATATFGLFHGTLLKYYASADVVTTPNDWFKVQDWKGAAGLDFTIRDPWMARPSLLEGRLADAGDQCAPHAGPEQDGQACVVAVIRYKGQLLTGTNVTVTTFTANGTALRESVATFGTLILKVPLNTSVFAKANYRETSPGTYEGKQYDVIDHWATAYARIERSPSVLLV